MAKRKRILITAVVAQPTRNCETATHREFFTFPMRAEHTEEMLRAVRFRFARKHNVDQEAVTIEQSLEKLHYHTPGITKLGTAEEYNARRAVQYAEWLAERDGLAVPAERNIKARCDWTGIYSKARTRNSRRWDGSLSEQPAYLKRVRAVEWGTEWKEEVYNTRKDGKRGAWSHNLMHFDVLLRVEIPNWDFEHPEPVEELLEQAA